MAGALRRFASGLLGRMVQKAGQATSWADAWLRGQTLGRAVIGGWNSAHRAMSTSGVAAPVRLTSGNVGKLPLHAYRMLASGDRERARGHWCEELLQRPNSWQTGLEFRRMLTAHCELHGNGYALKRYEGARVVELIPFPDPTKMRVTQEAFDLPPTYTYSDPKGPRDYAASEIFHLRDLTLDGVTGLSRVIEMDRAISMALAAEQFGISFFDNGGQPGLTLKYKRNLKKEEREQIIEAYLATQGGPGNAFKPFVIENDGDVMPMGSANNKNSQLLELRSFQVEDIASRRFNVPPHMVGLTEKQTSFGTGYEQATLGYLQFSLLDRLLMWETTIKRDLLSDEADRGIFLEHVVEGLLRGDYKTRMEGNAVAIQNGILSPDEVRKQDNLGPRADGKGGEYWKPSNMRGDEDPAEQVLPATMPSERPAFKWRLDARIAARALAERAERKVA